MNQTSHETMLMADRPRSDMIQVLRDVPSPRGDDATDASLMDAFVQGKDDAAFAELVRRHSAMVWGVCLRSLGHSQDAEDAFQATFLVLVKKAHAVRPPGMVGNWLFGVARRTALKAKSLAARRQAREKPMLDVPANETYDPKTWFDVRPKLDAELERLADKYRVPVLLCDVEGVSQRDAARQLGWPEGTLTTRLTRARQMLAKRLTKSGLALSAGGLAAMLSHNAAIAAAPTTLVSTTLKAATLVAAGQSAAAASSASVAALTEGVLKAMILAKIKSASLIVLAVAFLTTGGIATHRVLANRHVEPVNAVVDDEAYQFAFFQERGGRDGGRPVDPPTVTGKITAVSADGKSITVTTPAANRGDDPLQTEVKITDKTKLTYSGVGPGDAKLTQGLMAHVWIGDDKAAASVLLQGNQGTLRNADFQGKVSAVSKDGNTLTFELPPERGAERGAPLKTIDVKITPKSIVTFSNVAKGNTKPAEGYGASVWYEKGSKENAAVIALQGSDGPARERSSRQHDVAGKVVTVSKDGKSITIETAPQGRDGGDAQRAAYAINDKTQLIYVNIVAGGDQPTEGYLARVWLADNAKDTAAIIVMADAPRPRLTTTRGQVNNVAKDAKSFTLQTPPTERGGEPGKTTVNITPDTRLVFMGVQQGGALPTDGYLAEVTFEEGSTSNAQQVVFIGAGGPRGLGDRR